MGCEWLSGDAASCKATFDLIVSVIVVSSVPTSVGTLSRTFSSLGSSLVRSVLMIVCGGFDGLRATLFRPMQMLPSLIGAVTD